jgi:DNA polymerase-3 subunit alpha
MKPQNIEDLIAANALYRPGPMGSGYHENYIKCKNEGKMPEYLWGTEEITKNTFGMVIYQEQIMEVFQKVGGLSLLEADDVRRAMGKKKVDILRGWKDKVKEGFESKGCSPEEFEQVWDALLEFAKYGFNRSHSAAYAMTGYISQYMKVNHPLEYWTVALNYADETKGLKFLSEIFAAKKIKVEAPSVNYSDVSMTSNQENQTIYWGIESIKGIGEKTAEQIINERENGLYKSFEDFYIRHKFKGSTVKKQTYESLIACGAFDTMYSEDKDFTRSKLIEEFRVNAKVKLSEVQKSRDPYSNENCDKDWWWELRQKSLTGLVFIDYKKMANMFDLGNRWCTVLELSSRQDRGIYKGFGGYVVEFKEGQTKKGKYARMIIENNYKLYKIIT